MTRLKLSQAQVPSFMLLPDYTYTPDKDIHLGTLLLLSEETKLPDPDHPFNSTDRVPILLDEVRKAVEAPWSFVQGQKYGGSASFDAELPVFSPVGGGIGYGKWKNEDLAIYCERLETTRFVPSYEYLSTALNNDRVKSYCVGRWFPSLYLVTGLKVAYNAVIKTGRSSGWSGHGNVSADLTPAGVPVKLGPSLGGGNDTHLEYRSTVQGPFVLAYQLKRLKLKRSGLMRKAEVFGDLGGMPPPVAYFPGSRNDVYFDSTTSVLEGTGRVDEDDEESETLDENDEESETLDEDDEESETLDELWEVEDVLPTTDHMSVFSQDEPGLGNGDSMVEMLVDDIDVIEPVLEERGKPHSSV